MIRVRSRDMLKRKSNWLSTAVLSIQLFVFLIFFLPAPRVVHAGDGSIPNIVIQKNQSPSPCSIPVDEESTINYNLSLSETNGDAAFDVTVSDILPDLAAPFGLPPECDFAGGVVQCFFGIIEGLSTETINFGVTISPELPGTIQNQASVNFQFDPDGVEGFCSASGFFCDTIETDCPGNICIGGGEDDDNFCLITGTFCAVDADCSPVPDICITELTNFSNTVSCEVIGTTEVTIDKFSNTVSVPPGVSSQISYTVTLQNNNDVPAVNLTVQDILPAGAEFISASESCTEQGGVVTCSVDSIPAGQSTILIITISITPEPGRTTIENIANLLISGDTIASDTFTITVGEVSVDPNLGGRFTGDVTFNRINPPFPEDMQATDPTDLEVVLESDSSFQGTISALWLPNVAISGEGSGNTLAFSGSFQEIMGADCPGQIMGTIILTDPNSVEVNGMGEDCKSPYAFTGMLNRLGAGGGGDGSGAGCSIVVQSGSSNPISAIIYLLIPAFILIRRGWKRMLNRVNRSKSNKRTDLLLLLILPAILLALVFWTPSSVYAQSLIKDCPDCPAAAPLEVICSELAGLETLTPEQQDLLNICDDLIGGDPDEVRNALEQLQQEEIAAVYANVLRLQANNQFKVIRGRISDLRRGVASSVSLKGMAPSLDGQTGTGPMLASVTPFTFINQVPTNESSFERLGIFVNSSFNFGDKDQTSNEPGFDFFIFEITGGVDYRFTDAFIMGLSFNYTRTDVDLDLSRGNVDSNGYSGSIYASLYPWKQLYIDGIATLGWIDYDIKRNIDFTVGDTSVGQTARGDTNGLYYAFGVSAGYDFYIGAFTFGPYARFNYSKADIDRYKEKISGESEGFGLALDVEGQDAESLTTALGAQLSYAISTPFGVLVPQGLFEWVHEYKDDEITSSANFLAGRGLENNPAIRIRTDEPDRDTFNLGGGLSATFPYGISAFVYYEAVLGWDDFTANYITVGLRKEL